MIGLLVLLWGRGVVVVETVAHAAHTHYMAENGPGLPASCAAVPSFYSTGD